MIDVEEVLPRFGLFIGDTAAASLPMKSDTT
jgi:hypothetical protein